MVMVVMRRLRVMRHNGCGGCRCCCGCSAAGDGSDDGCGDCVWLVMELLVKRRLLVLTVRFTDHRARSRHCSCAVVEVMKTVEVIPGRIGGCRCPDAVRWCHGYGRAVRVELVSERSLQFRYGGYSGAGATTTTCHRIYVILASRHLHGSRRG